jgi:type I site-specific restriction-modification system R (restriction) subunit
MVPTSPQASPARVIDFDLPGSNDWLAVNQFTVSEGQHTRRPDVVLFVNGLPLAVIELKNPADENATVWSAWQQLQTYQAQIPALFATNAALVVSDGVQARIGALGAVKVLGDDTVRAIARELVETVRKNVTIDWTIRENVRAQLRVLVKRILRKHGYPPDKQEKAPQTVLEQAEVLSEIWAGA